MQIRLLWGFQNLVKRLPQGKKNLSIDTKNTSVCDLVENLEYFIFFGIQSVDLC